MKQTMVPMSEGPIASRMINFALPIFLGNLFQQLYNTADSLIVGNFLGSNALAAVSSSGSLIFMLIGFLNGIAMGAGVIIARYFGAQDNRSLRIAVHTTTAFGLAASVSADSGRSAGNAGAAAVDGYAGGCYGRFSDLFADLFCWFAWLCHVQYFCRDFAGGRRQQASVVLSDRLVDRQCCVGYPVHRRYGHGSRRCGYCNDYLPADQRGTLSVSAAAYPGYLPAVYPADTV